MLRRIIIYLYLYTTRHPVRTPPTLTKSIQFESNPIATVIYLGISSIIFIILYMKWDGIY